MAGDQVHFHFRCGENFAKAFDKLWQLSGYGTRQECLQDLMRDFMLSKGPKQVELYAQLKKTKCRYKT